MADLKELKRQIRELTGPQLTELRKYINNWRTTDQPSEGSLWTVEVFEAECKQLMLGFVQPAVRDIVRSHTPELTSFIDQACPGAKTLTKRVVLATGINLLYRNLREMGVTVSPKVLANNLPRLPAVLDAAFPGYARSGMLNMIVKRG